MPATSQTTVNLDMSVKSNDAPECESNLLHVKEYISVKNWKKRKKHMLIPIIDNFNGK